MELLNLTLPKETYLLDFLAEEEMKEKIQNSWILIHDRIIAQLISNDGFKRKAGMHSLHILERYKEKVSEEIVIDKVALSFRNWSALVAIMGDKNGKYEQSYDSYMITEPKYLIMLKMKE